MINFSVFLPDFHRTAVRLIIPSKLTFGLWWKPLDRNRFHPERWQCWPPPGLRSCYSTACNHSCRPLNRRPILLHRSTGVQLTNNALGHCNSFHKRKPWVLIEWKHKTSQQHQQQHEKIIRVRGSSVWRYVPFSCPSNAFIHKHKQQGLPTFGQSQLLPFL